MHPPHEMSHSHVGGQPHYHHPPPSGGLLEVHVVGASNLPKADKMSASDPYVEVVCENQTHKTNVVKNNPNPRWDQKFQLRIMDPLHSALRFIIRDKDKIGKDKRLGACVCQLDTLRIGKPSDCVVKVLDGSPPCTLHVTLLATNFGVDDAPPVVHAPPIVHEEVICHDSPPSSCYSPPPVIPAPPMPIVREVPPPMPIQQPPIIYKPRRDERLLAEYRRAKQRRSQLCKEYESELCDVMSRCSELSNHLAVLEAREAEIAACEHDTLVHHIAPHHHGHHHGPVPTVERHHYIYEEEDAPIKPRPARKAITVGPSGGAFVRRSMPSRRY